MKRFYETVSLEPQDDLVRLLLDGRSVKTPAKAEVKVPPGDFAEALAAEWGAQAEEIDPASMPLTRLANTVIDGVSTRRAEVAADVVGYGHSDLVCYWADAPAALVEAQERHWRPVLAWASTHLGANFKTTVGITAISQEPAAIAALAADIAALDDYALAALHEMTSLSGSVLISLAVLRGGLSAEAAWQAAHLDETYQAEQWGVDDEAKARLDGREASYLAAVRALGLLGTMPAKHPITS